MKRQHMKIYRAKMGHRGKFIALNAYIKNKNDLN